MSVVDEVKQRTDVVELISRYTTLKKTGNTYKGLCPFHSERTPSFVVFPHTGTWHCFGACSDGGDVFSFLMRKENLDFREALEMLAQEAGVELERPDDDPTQRQRAALYAINQVAAAYFQEILHQHPAAQAARAYLERRQVDRETTEQFGLGFALDGWDNLRNFLSERGYSLEDQAVAGLIKQNPERNSTYDAFRGRLIFPILDRQGRVIGFGGRVLDDGQPKYLNTAETPIFRKSRVVYGFDRAFRAISDRDQVVIVEGYMDVIAAHQHGYTNVVACMGTALTSDQLRQLQRYTDNFVLALDADAAGQQATLRGLNQARQALDRVRKPTVTSGGQIRIEERLGAHLQIISMPDGRDPDDVIRLDAQLWQQLVDSARPLVDFYFAVVTSQYDLESARGKASAVTDLAELIAELNDDIERQHYVQQLSRLVQIDERTIAGRVQAAAKTIQAGHKRPVAASRRTVSQQPLGPPINRLQTPETEALPPPILDADFAPEWLNDEIYTNGESPTIEAVQRPERTIGSPTQEEHLLANLLRQPDLLIWLAGATAKLNIPPLVASDLSNVENQEIFRQFKRFITSDEPWDPEVFQEELTSHLHSRLGQLYVYGVQLPDAHDGQLREDTVKVLVRLRLQRLKAESNKIKYLLDEAQRNGDREAQRRFDTTNNRNLREFFHLQRISKNLNEMLFDRRRQSDGVKIR